MKESRGQKKTIDYLTKEGAWTVKVILANKNGVPDVLACVPMTKEEIMELPGDKIGVFVAIEQKRESGGTLSKLQERTLRQIKKAGGLAGVARLLQDVKSILRRDKNEK